MGKISKVNLETINEFMQSEMEYKMSLLSQHLDVVKIMANTLFAEEVNSLAGEKYCRNKPFDGQYSRWGYNPGSIKVGAQKVPISIPRLYDNISQSNKSLAVYQQMQEVNTPDETLINSILHGLSMRDYPKVVEKLSDSFGLSPSNLSKKFVEASTQALKEFQERTLDDLKFVALFIDGKYLAKQQVIIVLGVTDKGIKIPIGLCQTTTENHLVIKALLSELIGRGLNFEDGLLVVIDGAKGLRKAVDQTFGEKAVIQRCTWHKRENVVSYLKEKDQKYFRGKLQHAYSQPDYHLAKEELLKTGQELKKISISAYNSLMEGFEETLALQKLGLHDFSRSFGTTNCIESLNSQIQKYTRKVKHWQTADQRLRWVAMAIMNAELRMNKVSNSKDLKKMSTKIKSHVESRQT
jgi:putative transposase